MILVAMATSLEKSENKVTIRHLHVNYRFHMVKRLWKSVQYIRRYSTKYAEPREHVTQFPFVSLFSAETTGPIFTKVLHFIVAFVVLLYFAYTSCYPIPFLNGIAIKVIGPGKTPIFRLWLVAMATSLEKSKKLNEVSKPLHPSTNPEVLVKIAPLASELRG